MCKFYGSLLIILSLIVGCGIRKELIELNIEVLAVKDTTDLLMPTLTILKDGFEPLDTSTNIMTGKLEYRYRKNENQSVSTVFYFDFAGYYPRFLTMSELNVMGGEVYLKEIPDHMWNENLTVCLDTVAVNMVDSFNIIVREHYRKYQGVKLSW